MGGTEILQPLRFALEGCSIPAGYTRQIILLTDGKVCNEQQVIDYVRGKGSKIFSLGIGSGVSTFLVSGLARATDGHAAFVQDGEQLEPVCISMLQKALTPAVSNLKVSWPASLEDDFLIVDSPSQARCAHESPARNAFSFFDPQQKDQKAFQPPPKLADIVLKGSRCQQAPQMPPPIFADSQFTAFAIYPKGKMPTGDVEITGLAPGGTMTLHVPLPSVPSRRDQGLVHQMAARALIRDIEEDGSNIKSDDAIRLSLHFSVLCRATAFVAIDPHSGCEFPVSTEGRASALEKTMKAEKPACQAIQARPPTGHWYSRDLRAPRAVTNAVSWRSEGIRHTKNEVFLAVVDGSLLKSEAQGVLRLKSFLSGMPELKLVLNDKLVRAEQLAFHQCVRLARFEHDRTLSFIPPDGEFDLMRYCADTLPKPPIHIKADIFRGVDPTNTEYVVTVKALSKAHRIEIQIPLPPDAHGPKLGATKGPARYAPEQKAVVWSIDRIEGWKAIVLSVKFNSTSTCTNRRLRDYGKPPSIRASFELLGLAASGVGIRYLKIIEKSGYKASKHVRYVTRCNDSLHRLPL
eukprot:gnl/TRDRNA2_/TRDRNA2_163429_c0_seq2.p1 gnl/TRDRNA2_/TRDRNA2_163429_c0~~gnl/TRDRNA2_/TRDRNA2_163429_c0_seq2.p1  ORF type:complete len:657 (-),score=90.10 gnl/TRDRNA2_/TRDRNA2_163429_c0_seq2:63-1790(-)